jgi:hypothetical protein
MTRSGSPLPSLTPLADSLQLNAGANWSQALYFEQNGAALSFPQSFVIEARLRVVSSATVGNTYCPCEIHWTPGNGVGNGLGFRAGQIFLWQSGNTAATPVNIDTTNALHTYRIEVDGTAAGSAIRVYQDGSHVLSGTTYLDAGWHGSTPRIYWGDGTGQGSSVSDWASFRHNALADLPVKQGQMLFGYTGKSFSALSTSNGVAKALCTDTNVPASPYEYVTQLTRQPSTGLLYGLITPVVGGNPTPKMLRIDPFTGQSAVVGFIQTADGVIKEVEGLAFHPLTGQLYGSMRVASDPANASPNLILIDPDTGVATRIGSLAAGQMKSNDIDTLAFSDDGTLYATDGYAITSEWGTYLYTLYQPTPEIWHASHQGTRRAKLFAGFTYSRQEGVFYCTEPDTRKLYRVTTSMAATEIGVMHPSVTAYGLALAAPVEHSPLDLTRAGGGFQLDWPSNSGLRYQVWSSTDLSGWETYGAPAYGFGSELTLPVDTESEPKQFFKLHILDSP